MGSDSQESTPPKHKKSPKNPRNAQPINDIQIQILQQNKNLRKKLKLLSSRLDEELERAAKNRLKANKDMHSIAMQNQSVQLQNAYKIIERLQKSVKDYQNKEEFQINYKRISELENLIKKQENENEVLKQELRDAKKIIREKDKHINELIQKQSVNYNINEEKDQVHRLKQKMKTVVAENEELKKKEMEKHKKLVEVERKLVEIQQEREQPIGKQEELLNNYEKEKAKYKEAMVRIQKQNAYITKLHSKISQLEEESNMKKSRSYHISTKQTKHASKSVDELPDLSNGKIKSSLLEHIPSPNLPAKLLRRY